MRIRDIEFAASDSDVAACSYTVHVDIADLYTEQQSTAYNALCNRSGGVTLTTYDDIAVHIPAAMGIGENIKNSADAARYIERLLVEVLFGY